MTRIALAQITSSTDKNVNLQLSRELIAQAAGRGASLIAFPEFLMAYSPSEQSAEELCTLAESVDGPFISKLSEAANANSITVLATIYEKCELPARVYDTALWIDANGKIGAVYRKLHLYDALGFKESDKFVAGDEIVPPFETTAGKVGLMICYDLRFPELSRVLTLGGAEILLAPSGWVQGEMKVEHWQTMIRARALENGCYVVAPDQVGNIYVGHSMVVDPFGRILAEMGENEGLEIVDIDPTVVAEVRQKLPLLKNRRAEIYSKYTLASKN